MNDTEKRAAAKEFAKYWKDKGYEKGESQKFWLCLLGRVLDVSNVEQFISFEDKVHLDHTSFIDAYISATHVLIEQKSVDKDLRKAIKQSDGTFLTPFQQAQRYSSTLPYSLRPRWIVTSNFKEFLIYDMEKPTGEPESILLKDLPKEYYRLQFLVDTGDVNIKKEMEISIKAGELVGVLYDEILKQYINPDDEHTLKSLNALCVRLVFCLYAEDAEIFGEHLKFHNYLKGFATKDIRLALKDLFKVLDTKIEDRDPYMHKDLASFPYVNGGLFVDENIEIPQFTQHIVDVLLQQASEDFDWSEISPTIFGAVFESTLNPETRRSGGMHYTTIENIHKVIDPLFLDGLKEELEKIKHIAVTKMRNSALKAFQNKLASLAFLDPACGSGNFLTETYISLRRLENEVISELNNGRIVFGLDDIIKVSIKQFYGIEINDFAVTVAKTALWIAESQMLKETEDIVCQQLDFLPLKSYANIVEGNALTIDWETVVPKDKLNYIMGNPPFVGHQMRSTQQINDLAFAFYDLKKHGKLDYVCGWYNKAADYMQNSTIKTAFVSTNSICQGESVPILWRFLFGEKRVEIQFAYQTFIWSSEASDKAAVHCVIIGFSCFKSSNKKALYNDSNIKLVDHINGYLLNAIDISIISRGKQLNDKLPKMFKGSQATDGLSLILEEADCNQFLLKYPDKGHLVKKYMGSFEFINNKNRYCFWLKDISPAEYKNNTFIVERLKKVVDFRQISATESVRAFAQYPYLFTQIRQPNEGYLAFPAMSSARRKYIPIGYVSSDVIASNQLYVIPKASLFMFGVLTSNVHNAWMRVVCGRLKSDYRYAPAIYNNFPWCNPTDEQKSKIEQTAQAILDARALYSDCSLADLYDEVAMPSELRKAHQANDKAVMQAYGFSIKMTESECVAALMKMYQKLTK